MSVNSPNPPETGNPELLAIQNLREWLQHEGGNSHSAHVLLELAELTARCMERGDAPPQSEMEGLRLGVLSREGGKATDTPANKWLPTKDLNRWWQSRESTRFAYFLSKGMTIQPTLHVQDGGGRGNLTRFSFRFVPIEAEVTTIEEIIDESTTDIHYAVEPVNAVFWLRWLLPGQEVLLHSWRGGFVALAALAGMALMPILVLLMLSILAHDGSIRARDLQQLLFVIILAIIIYRAMRPWIELPDKRITIAPDFILPTSKPYGQIQLIRNVDKKRSGWLSVVRHHSTCSFCSGTVELDNGKHEFSGRIIGRCRDSPLEHVFSFDPVSGKGKFLR